MRSLTLTRPDDWHVHLRDGDYLADTVADIARYFGRAVVMPNLVPAVDTPDAARDYCRQIESLVPSGSEFKPLMTLYITSDTRPETVSEARKAGLIHAFKLYPAGATTNSSQGISNIRSLYPVFEAMEKEAMPLCVHGEVTDVEVDIFDREARFIDESLVSICHEFPSLKVIFEHITTTEAIEFVKSGNDHLAATITAHHLLYNRNHMLAAGIKPLYYCLPILKRSRHQRALLDAATSGNPKFFLGSDSAPHPRQAKENICGCAAGSYTAHAAIQLYAEAFDSADCLHRLEAFASFYGPDFYNLARNQDTITLDEESWRVAETLRFGNDELVPIRTGELINWKVRSS